MHCYRALFSLTIYHNESFYSQERVLLYSCISSISANDHYTYQNFPLLNLVLAGHLYSLFYGKADLQPHPFHDWPDLSLRLQRNCSIAPHRL